VGKIEQSWRARLTKFIFWMSSSVNCDFGEMHIKSAMGPQQKTLKLPKQILDQIGGEGQLCTHL
jgi:hypothetical protein